MTYNQKPEDPNRMLFWFLMFVAIVYAIAVLSACTPVDPIECEDVVECDTVRVEGYDNPAQMLKCVDWCGNVSYLTLDSLED